MSPARRGPARRGYVLVVLIVVTGVVLAFVLLMARLTVLEAARQRQSALDIWVDEILASAQEWSRLHADELAGHEPVRLPLEDLLARGLVSAVELQRETSGDRTLIRCRITLVQARTHLRREFLWALPSSAPPTSPPD